MKVLIESERFSPEELVRVEAHYSAKYVCETCLKGPNGWVNNDVSVFYQSDPAKVPEGGSQWFGLFFHSDDPYLSTKQLCIVNAISATEHDIDGIVAANGDVIYSRYRHDCRWSPDNSVMIDGGRDYTRYGGPDGQGGVDLITLRIVKDELVIVETE